MRVHIELAFALFAAFVVLAPAKPSHPFDFHGVVDHLDLVPPVLPPALFHPGGPGPVLPYPHHETNFLPPLSFHAPAPVLPAPAPLLPAPAPLLPAPAPFIHVPAPFLPVPAPAPAPILPAPVAATPILSHVLETVPVIEPIPSYRAIPGPKTTTHHLSVGYAFPQARFSKLHAHLHAAPHAHLHAAPWTLTHHHHKLF